MPDPDWLIITADCIGAMSGTGPAPARLSSPTRPTTSASIMATASTPADPAEYLAWSGRWIEAATRLLTPDGLLWLLVNHEWSARLRIRHGGRRAAPPPDDHLVRDIWGELPGKFNRRSRPLLWMVPDPRRHVFHAEAPEIRRPSDRQAKYRDKRANTAGKLLDDVWMIPRLAGTDRERTGGSRRSFRSSCDPPGRRVWK